MHMHTSVQKPSDQLAPHPLCDQVPAPEWVQLLIGQGACMRQVRKTAYSHVLEVRSDHGRYYLKRNPPGYIHEAKLLMLFAEHGVPHVPQLIGYDEGSRDFLVACAGSHTLREKWVSTKALDLARTYAAIHWSSTGALGAMRNVGIPVLDAAHLLQALQALQAFDVRWSDARWQAQLQVLTPRLHACLDHGPRGVLHHDIHDGNAVLHDLGMTVIDWSEVSVGNPLISLAQMASKLQARYGCDATMIEQAYLLEWERLSGENRQSQLDACRSIAPYFYAYTLVPLIAAQGQAMYDRYADDLLRMMNNPCLSSESKNLPRRHWGETAA